MTTYQKMHDDYVYSLGRAAYEQFVLLNRKVGGKWGLRGDSTHFKVLSVSAKSMRLWCTHGSWAGDLHFDDEGNPIHLQVIVTTNHFPIPKDCAHMTRLSVSWWADQALDVPPTPEEEVLIVQAEYEAFIKKYGEYKIPF
jgi:hypothetical protein